MDFLADLLLASGAFGAAAYCLVLARRLRALTRLDSGMGSAIALLSAQVDELARALAATRAAAQAASGGLSAQTERAEGAARRLELLIAALHDLPESAEGRPAPGGAGPASVAPPAPEGVQQQGSGTPRARILRRRLAEAAT